MPPAAPIPVHSGVSAVADRYAVFVLDLWGVLHNGVEPYPGVIDCLADMRAAGKRICLLSNAPRRRHAVLAQMGRIGLPTEGYDLVMSSGEATNSALLDPTDPVHSVLGATCYHLGPERDANVFEGVTHIERVDRLEDAAFIVNTGIDKPDETVEQYEPVLAAGAARKLPMVCANPDLVVNSGDRLAICAGLLAQRYEELGGTVHYHGKPHPPIYHRVFAELGIADPNAPGSRVVAIGDGLRTDIAGANAVGIDSILVTGGIHEAEFGGSPPDPERIAAVAAEVGVRPQGAMTRLVW